MRFCRFAWLRSVGFGLRFGGGRGCAVSRGLALDSSVWWVRYTARCRASNPCRASPRFFNTWNLSAHWMAWGAPLAAAEASSPPRPRLPRSISGDPIQVFAWQRCTDGSLPPSLPPVSVSWSTDEKDLQIERLLTWRRTRTNPFEGNGSSSLRACLPTLISQRRNCSNSYSIALLGATTMAT